MNAIAARAALPAATPHALAPRTPAGHRMNTSVELVAVGCTVCQAGFGVHTAGFASVAALTSATPLLRRRA